MRAEAQTKTLSELAPTINDLNEARETFMPSCPEFTQEEYAVLMGRYASSHIRYTNEGQFWCAFFGINLEGLEKLRAKLRANKWIRNLENEEVLQGESWTTTDKAMTNQATNPDTEPSTNTDEPLEYINSQTTNKSKQEQGKTLGNVSGIYSWKHSLGSQAYQEWLDSMRDLFIKILAREEITIYGF